MKKILTMAPLLVIPILVYHLIAIPASGGVDGSMAAPIFRMSMISGGIWTLSVGDAVLMLGLGMLFLEIIKATSTRTISLANHGMSTLLLIVCLIEFLVLRSFATSTFFLLMLMALLDVIAGFMVSTVSARRDFGVGDGF